MIVSKSLIKSSIFNDTTSYCWQITTVYINCYSDLFQIIYCQYKVSSEECIDWPGTIQCEVCQCFQSHLRTQTILSMFIFMFFLYCPGKSQKELFLKWFSRHWRPQLTVRQRITANAFNPKKKMYFAQTIDHSPIIISLLCWQKI